MNRCTLVESAFIGTDDVHEDDPSELTDEETESDGVYNYFATMKHSLWNFVMHGLKVIVRG